MINIPQFGDGAIIRRLANLGILYLPQLIERCQGDIKRFFEVEVGQNLPIEDLKQIYKALERIPLVELKYTIAKTNSQDEILSG